MHVVIKNTNQLFKHSASMLAASPPVVVLSIHVDAVQQVVAHRLQQRPQPHPEVWLANRQWLKHACGATRRSVSSGSNMAVWPYSGQ